MKKVKICGNCKHYKDGICTVANEKAAYYDDVMQCSFPFLPHGLSVKLYAKMLKKVS